MFEKLLKHYRENNTINFKLLQAPVNQGNVNETPERSIPLVLKIKATLKR